MGSFFLWFPHEVGDFDERYGEAAHSFRTSLNEEWGVDEKKKEKKKALSR